MKSVASSKDTPALDRWLAYVFGHPVRAQIAATLRQRPLSPQELADTLDVPLLRVAYHYAVLARANRH